MTTRELLNSFTRLSALVVGDICLDRWCAYDPDIAEPSRETGLPRVGVIHTDVTPGAGGTVANNLAALRARKVSVLGTVGKDGFGWELSRALKLRGIGTELLVSVADQPTFTYTKLINSKTGEEDKPRLDFVYARALAAPVEKVMLERLRAWAPKFDIVIVADQAETNQGGVVTPAMRDLVAELAHRHPEKAFWADSRKRSHLFRKVIVKPNQAEADAACMHLFGEVDYQKLRHHLETRWMVITFGPKGALVVKERGEVWAHAQPVEKPVDICGAGDSFTAGAALAYAVTGSPEKAARFGNLTASITIMKKGTGVASRTEVFEKAPEEAWA